MYKKLNSKLLYASLLGLFVVVLFASELHHIALIAEGRTLFLFSADYFFDKLSHTAGMEQYLVAFVAQFFYYPILGATILGVIFGVSYWFLSASTDNGDPLMLALALPLYLLTGYGEAQFLNTILALFVGSATVRLWSCLSINAKLYGALPLSAFLYFIIGIAYAPFALFFSVRLLTECRNKIIPVILLSASALVPWAAAYIYVVPVEVAYMAGAEYTAMFNLKLILLVLIYTFAGNLLPNRWFSNKTRALISVSLFTIFSTLFLCDFYKNLRPTARTIMLMEQAADFEQWDKVLEISAGFEGENRMLTYLTNVALFRKGNFTEHLFDHPQRFGEKGLFLEWTETNEAVNKIGEGVYANVGIMNNAIRWVFESYEQKGESHPQLRRLVAYNRAIGEDKIADKFERKLDKSLFYAGGRNGIRFKPERVARCSNDFVINNNDFAENLREVVAADSLNYGALDYLMAYYLLSHQMERFVEYTPRALARYGGALPQLYEEALAVCKSMNIKGFEELNYTISPQTIRRMQTFTDAMQSSNPRSRLENSFANSYWFYMVFDSPYKNRR